MRNLYNNYGGGFDPNNFGDPRLREIPDFMGHATFPSQMKNKSGVFDMLRTFGGELYAISQSEQKDYETIDGERNHNTGYDINAVGARIENVLYKQEPMQVQPNSPIYRGRGAAQTAYNPYQHQQFQNNNNINFMNDDIEQYLGGSSSANTGNTTTTSIDFSNALKPLEAKAEIICKILGKIYQVENDTNMIMKGLGQEIAESISASIESYMNQGMSIPAPDEYTTEVEA